MHGLEPGVLDVGVDLRGGNIGVPQKFLNDPEVGTAAEEMSRKAVPHEMRVNALFQSGACGMGFHDLPQAGGCHALAVMSEEDVAAGALCHKSGPLAGQILCDGVERLFPDGNEARFVPLPGDADDAVLGVEILQTCSREFTCAESAGVKKLEHRLVPEPEWLRCIRRGEKALDVTFVERFR